jgi:raffinose/stachyose/melibiose transport system permease protein
MSTTHPRTEAVGSRASAVAARGRRRRRRSSPAGAPAIWFAVPALLIYGLIVIYPSLAGAAYAFTDWSGIGKASWVGLENFKRLFTDPQSFGALKNTLKLTVFIVVVQNFIGLLLALGVHTRIKSRFVLRTIFFAPAVLSPVVLAFLWKYLFNPAPDAGLNALLGFFGLDFLQQNWLGDPSVALWAIGITVVWMFAGYSMVIFLAALQGIPQELEEAASLDGAGRFQRFWHVVLPLIAPAMTINLTLSTIGGLKLFDQVFAITNGGPGYATETLSTLIYKQAFVFGKYGYSTAVALVLALLVSTLALIQMRYLQSREVSS